MNFTKTCMLAVRWRRPLITKGSLLTFLLLSLYTLSGKLPVIKADDSVSLLSISAQTEDFVSFQVSASRRRFAAGEDIVIRYTVKNNSGKVIYLVAEPKSRLSADQKDNILKLAPPVRYPAEWVEYNYDLVRIGHGKSFSGKLIIKGNEVVGDREYESEEWNVQVGFSYVINPSSLDLSELLSCKSSVNTVPCLGKLFKISKSLTIGNLMIEVKNQ